MWPWHDEVIWKKRLVWCISWLLCWNIDHLHNWPCLLEQRHDWQVAVGGHEYRPAQLLTRQPWRWGYIYIWFCIELLGQRRRRTRIKYSERYKRGRVIVAQWENRTNFHCTAFILHSIHWQTDTTFFSAWSPTLVDKARIIDDVRTLTRKYRDDAIDFSDGSCEDVCAIAADTKVPMPSFLSLSLSIYLSIYHICLRNRQSLKLQRHSIHIYIYTLMCIRHYIHTCLRHYIHTCIRHFLCNMLTGWMSRGRK